MMENDLADKLDLEWHSIFQKHLRYFSYQNKSETYSFEDILKNVFCPDPDAEQQVNYKEKEIFEKCLLEALNLLSHRQTLPRQAQVRQLLNIAKYVTKDESCFVNLNANNIFLSLIYLSQLSTEKSTDIVFMEFLSSLLEHTSGVKWLMEAKYFLKVFESTVNYQDKDDQVLKMGYGFLRLLLEKTVDMDKNYSNEIMALIANSLLSIAQRIKLGKPNDYPTLDGLKPNLTCLVKILEGLLKNYGVKVLQYMTDLKVAIACDTISEKCKDVDLCLLLDRISMILSLFGFIDVFDGIKSIKQDPLELCGIIKIIDKEVDKGLFIVVFELLHYALQYFQFISDKMPKYFVGVKQINIDSQLVALQLEPILLEWTRLNGATNLWAEPDRDCTSITHPLKVFKNLGQKALYIGFKIRDKLPPRSFDVYTKAVENITRSKDLYSKKNLCDIINTLVYALEAPLRYLQSKTGKVTIEHAEQIYIVELLDATLVFIKSFNLNWSDSIKMLDLLYIVIECSSSYQWIEPIMLDSLILLQEIISRRISPSMALLMDTAEGLKNIGPLLYKTCFTNNWKIRKAVLNVVHAITLNANNCFTSFKAILFSASLPPLVLTMSLNDESFPVRATALKCLQQMIVMEDIEEILPKNDLTNKFLETILKNVDEDVTIEAIKLIKTIYADEKCLDSDVTINIYKCLERTAFSKNTNDNVQMEVADFWRSVIRKKFNSIGWINTLLKFPEVTFSKRIISMTSEEINKRCYKALSELSRIGCLNVFKKYFDSIDQYANTKKSLMEILSRLNYIYSMHKITPESMLFSQEFLDLSSIQLDLLVSPQESEDILKEIIGETMMEIPPAELEYITNKDSFALMDAGQSNINIPSTTTALAYSDDTKRVTPSEFVALIYRKVSELSDKGEGNAFKNNPPNETDVYIIDY